MCLDDVLDSRSLDYRLDSAATLNNKLVCRIYALARVRTECLVLAGVECELCREGSVFNILFRSEICRAEIEYE